VTFRLTHLKADMTAPSISPARPLTLSEVVATHAAHRADAVAFVAGETAVTYAELDRRAERVSAALLSCGIKTRDVVAFLGKNSIEFMEVAVGTVRAGGVFAPLNWRLAAAELAFMLKDCAAQVIVIDAEYQPMLQALADELPDLRTLVVIAEAPVAGWESFGVWRDRERPSPVRLPTAPDQVALLIYSSGTTGRPKGVLLTHRNARCMAGMDHPEGWPAWNLWRPDDCALAVAPMFHVGGFGWVLRGLFAGGTQVLLREFNSSSVIDAIQRHRITRAALVPSAMLMVLHDPAAATADFRSLEYVYYGSSPIALDVLREAMRVFGCRFAQSYGQTETSSVIVCLAPEDHTLDDVPHMRSAGKPLPGVEVQIRDGAGEVLPVGVIGEIVTRSPSNMAGYLNLPAETAAAIDAEGWLRTGDAGRIDAQGFVYVEDRIKDMIITGGENVYPAEVENAIFSHPAVAEVAVIGVPDPKWGQAVKAVVVVRPGKELAEAEVIAWARSRIGGYKCPKSVDFVSGLPRNTTGKVLKGQLRKQYAGS
jgi:acyl-CoA synthetase (AMP-forming)/AMP-acid ligase II